MTVVVVVWNKQFPVISGGPSTFRPIALVDTGCTEYVSEGRGEMMTLDPNVYIYENTMLHKGYVNDKEIVVEKP